MIEGLLEIVEAKKKSPGRWSVRVLAATSQGKKGYFLRIRSLRIPSRDRIIREFNDFAATLNQPLPLADESGELEEAKNTFPVTVKPSVWKRIKAWFYRVFRRGG